MTESWEFDSPGRFTVGAMGEPGSRIFYFQAFAEGVEVAVKCEKQQAVALAEHLVNLLADLPGEEAGPVPPAEALPPTELAWIVGSISIGVDHGKARLVVLLEELLIDDEGNPITRDASRLRVHLSREQVLGLGHQVQALVASARPICRLCEQPIDPDGHACARLN